MVTGTTGVGAGTVGAGAPASVRTLCVTRVVHMSGGRGAAQAPASWRWLVDDFSDALQAPKTSEGLRPFSLAKQVAVPVLSERTHAPQLVAQYDPHGQSLSLAHSLWQKPRVLHNEPSWAHSRCVSQRRGLSPMQDVAMTISSASAPRSHARWIEDRPRASLFMLNDVFPPMAFALRLDRRTATA